MKRILYIFLLFAAALSCNPDYMVYESGIGSKVYFLQAVSAVEVPVSQLSEEDGTIYFAVLCAGNNAKDVSVGLAADAQALVLYNAEHKTERLMLPEKYYRLETQSLTLNDRSRYRGFAELHVDLAAFEEDGLNADDYVLPLSLTAEDENVLSVEYRTLYLLMK